MLPVDHLLDYFIVTGHGSMDPGAVHDLFRRPPLDWVDAQHALDHLHEGRLQFFLGVFEVLGPVEVPSVRSDYPEVPVIWFCDEERRNSPGHDKQNYTRRENISCKAIVPVLAALIQTDDFWCHVGLRAAVGGELAVCFGCRVAGEPEVSQLQVEVPVEVDVVGLQVSVHDLVRMQVPHCAQKLFEIKPCETVSECSAL